MCDGLLYENRKVIVIGEGNSAMWEALALSKFTDNVTIMDSNHSFSAVTSVQERVRSKSSIRTIPNTHVDEVIGNGSCVTEIKVTNKATLQQYDIPVNGVFVAIGMEPQTSILRQHAETTPKGFLKISTSTQISIEGIFAAGNVCNTPYKQAIAAAGMGCMAAIDAENYLKTLFRKKKFQSPTTCKK